MDTNKKLRFTTRDKRYEPIEHTIDFNNLPACLYREGIDGLKGDISKCKACSVSSCGYKEAKWQ